MPSLNKRMDKIEDAHTTLAGVVSKHLEESGTIRTDLKWLKKLTWFILGAPFLIEAVKHVHLAGK